MDPILDTFETIAAMATYNPPAILTAVKDAGRQLLDGARGLPGVIGATVAAASPATSTLIIGRLENQSRELCEPELAREEEPHRPGSRDDDVIALFVHRTK